jgi:hypothetical protein
VSDATTLRLRLSSRTGMPASGAAAQPSRIDRFSYEYGRGSRLIIDLIAKATFSLSPWLRSRQRSEITLRSMACPRHGSSLSKPSRVVW